MLLGILLGVGTVDGQVYVGHPNSPDNTSRLHRSNSWDPEVLPGPTDDIFTDNTLRNLRFNQTWVQQNLTFADYTHQTTDTVNNAHLEFIFRPPDPFTLTLSNFTTVSGAIPLIFSNHNAGSGGQGRLDVQNDLTLNSVVRIGRPTINDEFVSSFDLFTVGGTTYLNTGGSIDLSRILLSVNLGDLVMDGGTLNLTTGTGSDGTDPNVENVIHAANLSGDGLIQAGKNNTMGALVVNGAGAGTFDGVIQDGATGAVVRLERGGSGSLTLTTANSYTGGTTITGGELSAQHDSALGSGAVEITGTGDATLQIAAGITLSNNLLFSNTHPDSVVQRQLNAAESFSTGLGSLTTNFAVDGRDTTVAFLAGTTTDSTTLEMGFSTTAAAANDDWRRSDVFLLSGMDGDPFVLQLAIDELVGLSYLGWNNGLEWVNAVEGNLQDPGSLAQQAVADSWANFFADGDLNDLSDYLGSWGYDTTEQTVWAVLNHNSAFAVIPEPGSLVLIMAGLLGLTLRRRPKSTACG